MNVGTHHAGTLEEADLTCRPELLHFCNFPHAAALGKLHFQQQGGSVAPNGAGSVPEEILNSLYRLPMDAQPPWGGTYSAVYRGISVLMFTMLVSKPYSKGHCP